MESGHFLDADAILVNVPLPSHFTNLVLGRNLKPNPSVPFNKTPTRIGAAHPISASVVVIVRAGKESLMKRHLQRASFCAVALSVIFSFITVGQSTASVRASVLDGHEMSKQAALHDAMRKLWEDHITWTRVFIISAVGDLPDKAAATERLLQNQVDIGNAIKPLYGESAGNKLTALLKEHITTAAEVIAAAKANDQAKLADASKRWFANADQIADFLSGANPKNWPQAEMRSMMKEHLDLTTQEAVARLHGDWAADVKAYDAVHQQILKMADELSMGIVKQFPEKFK
jgi:hypothetical protein